MLVFHEQGQSESESPAVICFHQSQMFIIIISNNSDVTGLKSDVTESF